MASFNDDFKFEFEVGEKENGEKVNLHIDVRHTIIVKTHEDNESTIEFLRIYTNRELEEITEAIMFASPDIYEEIEAMAKSLVDKKFEIYQREVA